MKKLFLSIAVIASLSIVSCSEDAKKAVTDATNTVSEATSTENTATTSASDSEESTNLIDKLKSCADPAKLMEYAQTAITKANGLLESKKFAEAKAFLAQVGPTIEEKVPSLTSTIDNLTDIAAKGDQASQYVDQANQVVSGFQNIKL